MELNVLGYEGQTVTNVCASFSVALHPQKPYSSLRWGVQDGHLDFHTAPELWVLSSGDLKFCICSPSVLDEHGLLCLQWTVACVCVKTLQMLNWFILFCVISSENCLLTNQNLCSAVSDWNYIGHSVSVCQRDQSSSGAGDQLQQPWAWRQGRQGWQGRQTWQGRQREEQAEQHWGRARSDAKKCKQMLIFLLFLINHSLSMVLQIT